MWFCYLQWCKLRSDRMQIAPPAMPDGRHCVRSSQERVKFARTCNTAGKVGKPPCLLPSYFIMTIEQRLLFEPLLPLLGVVAVCLRFYTHIRLTPVFVHIYRRLAGCVLLSSGPRPRCCSDRRYDSKVFSPESEGVDRERLELDIFLTACLWAISWECLGETRRQILVL